MNPDRYQRINAILDQVIDLPLDAQDQAITKLCNQLCQDDQTIESDVRRMLNADRDFQQTQSEQPNQPFLSTQAIDSARSELDELLNDPPPVHNAYQNADQNPDFPESIAGFTIIREIGRGGMGVVYECQQQNPKRRVAIKLVESILRAETLSKRLAAESHIQGQLQHPAIARVYDAGVTVIGHSKCPYFVMELIHGSPLNVYAHDQGLDRRAKAQLMSKVCEGMKHAHDRSIIHRDLKPDNILVEPEGQPKILDFGIARFIDDSTLITSTMHNMTGDGQVLGTLAYMAPEQLSGKTDQTDTRSDVFSLGAILYELLADHPPFQLQGMSLSTAFRTVELDDPISIRTIDTSIDKDLETIVMRCLSKEPDRRFTNAGELNDELIRYLTNQPIRSRPPTAAYRTKKFITRNKALVAGVSTTMIALIIGLALTMYFAAGQRDARILAQEQERIARSKELDAIRGVLQGTQALIQQDQAWQSIDLLYTIAPQSRGWEWEHLSSSLPWIQARKEIRQSVKEENSPTYLVGMIDSHTVIEHSRKNPEITLNNLITGAQQPINYGDLDPASIKSFQLYANNLLYLKQHDNTIAAFDPTTGTRGDPVTKQEPLPESTDLPEPRLVFASPDHQITAYRSGNLLHVYEGSQLALEISTDMPNHGGMQWNRPILDLNNQSMYLLSWNRNGEIIAINTDNWSIRARTPIQASGPQAALSPDGSILYANTDENGIVMLNTDDLSVIDHIDQDAGMVATLLMTPDGSKLIATLHDHFLIRIYDRQTKRILQSIKSGTRYQSTLNISPDSTILLGHTPAHFWYWMIPLDQEQKAPNPTNQSITHLRGHNSWVYQLAISPNGSLLASAEPETGDVLLWDLSTDQLIQRFKRPDAHSNLYFYMSSPLVFDPSGTKLSFGQHDQETKSRGLTTVDLQTGNRNWTPTASEDQTIDAAADIIGQGTIHHHASALPDGRILQASASVAYPKPVRVRGRVGSTTQPIELIGNSAGLTAGVALHPDGSVYASGEYFMTRIYDTQTDQLLHEFTDGNEDKIYAMTYSPDGSRLAMALENGTVLIFDTEFYTLLAKINVPPADTNLANPDSPANTRNYIFNLIWTPDGKRLITAGGTVLRILESERPEIRTPLPLSDDARTLIDQIKSWSS
ncbi:MAG: protein kinase [Phycisphaerales bacterium]